MFRRRGRMTTSPIQMIARIVAFVRSLSGWRAAIAMFTAGAFAALALPPAGVLPALYLAFAVLVVSLEGTVASDRSVLRAAFARGWWFAFGHQAAGWYWISNALLVYSSDFWWMVPFVALGLPAVLAVYYGIATALASRLGGPVARAIGLAVLWAGADWLRGHLFTGFPWNIAGYFWLATDGLAQSGALFGAYAMGLLALVSACLPAALLTTLGSGGSHGPSRKRVVTILAVALSLPLAFGAWGTVRLASAPSPLEISFSGVGFRVVQAGIPQREKWARQYQRRNFTSFLELSMRNRPPWVRHVIWPETSATFYIQDEADARRIIAEMLPADGLLLTGAPLRRDAPYSIHNGMAAIDTDGKVVATYEKSHLVPFGEYVPFADFLPIKKITSGAIDFSPGPGLRTLDLRNMPPMSPLICYEVIFPGAVIAANEARPEWLLNLTNDGWYGRSAGPYQHLAQTRLRAIEEGVPLVRAASTGISAVFDPYGREQGRIGLGQAGILDIRLPYALPPTLYARFGDTLFFALLAAAGALVFLLHRRRH